ncbi:glycoside hydrolase, partial [Fomitiporia mediterranea MF3/22]|uniref:glycoside hydrolase n=1 Tax=Fomitiporia mediterranea (strain MF3/22) TaxID=694068 RepID=UPI0004407A3A
YWGQDSYGATNPDDVANFQKPLGFYCTSDSVTDTFPVAFLTEAFGEGGLPSIDLANTCNVNDNATFPGTQLPDCSALAPDIEACQAAGKIVTLSIGGATGAITLSSDSEAEEFADTIWNIFLGGSNSTRPFGEAVLDGIDLDIEGGGSTGYAAFVSRIRSHAQGASKQYYITAAPQCPFPDANLGAVISAVGFDAVYVQFYNNFCGLQNFDDPNAWNFAQWDDWAHNTSPNPNVKVYIGAPASSTAAGSGYVDAATLANIIQTTQSQFSSFGGVMMWDASQAYANSRYDIAAKSALTGGSVTASPSSSSSVASTSTTISSSSEVTYNGHLWTAKWWSEADIPGGT